MDHEGLFTRLDSILNGPLANYGTVNYLSSHDDGQPFDPAREKPFETATKLLLSPGTSQVYYGDETARTLIVEGTVGDATLRSLMNWDEINSNEKTKKILNHWQKLGKFRAAHPAVGAGDHKMISSQPYYFSRTFTSADFLDSVIIGIDLAPGKKVVDVSSAFKNGDQIRDTYSGKSAEVKDGKVEIDSEHEILLLEKI